PRSSTRGCPRSSPTSTPTRPRNGSRRSTPWATDRAAAARATRRLPAAARRRAALSWMLRLLERAREQNVGVPALRSTDYINTIPPEREPWFPGDGEAERRIRAFLRWDAAVMVSTANRKGLEVGGHIATYQSSASLYEVGFNHFF